MATEPTACGEAALPENSREEFGDESGVNDECALLGPRSGGAELVQPPATAHVTNTSPGCHGTQLQ